MNDPCIHRHSSWRHAAIFAAGACTALLGAAIVLYGGAKARKRRDAIECWIDEVREDLLARMADIRTMTPKMYEAIIDEITSDASTAGELVGSQAVRAAARLKARYEEMKRTAEELRDEARDVDDR